ncbi:MAG: hypothetical protein P8Q97_16305 [Myxococcota bacterium]|jgi:hypothetical protein|nr:hypothetical protein [Myxococcota bacterium]
MFNLPLTAPYFHDGSAADLHEMLDFYIRGGNDVEQRVKLKKLDPRQEARGGRRGGRARGGHNVRTADVENVIKMLEGLTDPRIAEGTGPCAHPNLELVLDDGSFFWLGASDDPQAMTEPNPGLSYGPTIAP